MWINPLETADLFTFTKEIFHEKLRFFCSINFINPFSENVNMKKKNLSRYCYTYTDNNKYMESKILEINFQMHQALHQLHVPFIKLQAILQLVANFARVSMQYILERLMKFLVNHPRWSPVH